MLLNYNLYYSTMGLIKTTGGLSGRKKIQRNMDSKRNMDY